MTIKILGLSLSLWEGLEVRSMTNLLSQKSIFMSIETSKCLNNHYNQTTSLPTKARYFDFVKDLDTISCLVHFQKIIISPRKIQKVSG